MPGPHDEIGLHLAKRVSEQRCAVRRTVVAPGYLALRVFAHEIAPARIADGDEPVQQTVVHTGKGQGRSNGRGLRSTGHAQSAFRGGGRNDTPESVSVRIGVQTPGQPVHRRNIHASDILRRLDECRVARPQVCERLAAFAHVSLVEHDLALVLLDKGIRNRLPGRPVQSGLPQHDRVPLLPCGAGHQTGNGDQTAKQSAHGVPHDRSCRRSGSDPTHVGQGSRCTNEAQRAIGRLCDLVRRSP